MRLTEGTTVMFRTFFYHIQKIGKIVGYEGSRYKVETGEYVYLVHDWQIESVVEESL